MSKKDIITLEESYTDFIPRGLLVDNIPIVKFLHRLAIKVTGAKPLWTYKDIYYVLNKADHEKIVRLFQGLFAIGGIAVTGLVAFFIYVSVKALKERMTDAYKICKNVEDPRERNRCMLKFKIEAKQKQLEVLKKGYATCDKTKDPSKCKKQLLDKISKIQTQVKKLQVDLKDLNKNK